MSYYDNTVASYDSRIANNYARIDEYNSRIKQLEDDIEELKQLLNRVKKVDESVETATSKSLTKINNLPTVINSPFSFLKTNFFSSFLDVLKGSPERIRSNTSLSSAVDKVRVKIRELEDEIQDLRDAINQCNSNIASLYRQKTSYISDMERKIAEENAARQRAESEAQRLRDLSEIAIICKDVIKGPITTCPNQSNGLNGVGEVISNSLK